MTKNPFVDGGGIPAAALNALKHAFEGEGVKSGGAITPGTGDFEVDVTAVEYHVDDSGFSATADTLTHDAPDNEDRIDLITADTTQTLKIVKGDAAAVANQPDSPDIPTDEVLLGAVLIRSGADKILDPDIFDEYKTIVHLLEDWTTDSTTAGDVPVSQGDGTVQMDQGEGSNIDADTWREAEHIEETSTQGASGTVPVSQGDGSVSMDSGENSGIDADTVQGQAPDPDFAQAGTNTGTTEQSGGWSTEFSGDTSMTHTESIDKNAEAVRITYDSGDGSSVSGSLEVVFSSVGGVSEDFTDPGSNSEETESFSFGRRHVDEVEVGGGRADSRLTKLEVWTGAVDSHNHTQQS